MNKEGYYTKEEFLEADKWRDVHDKNYQAICIAYQQDVSKEKAMQMTETLPERAVANALDFYGLHNLSKAGISVQTMIKLNGVLQDARDEIVAEHSCSYIDAIQIREQAMGCIGDDEREFLDAISSIQSDNTELEQ